MYVFFLCVGLKYTCFFFFSPVANSLYFPIFSKHGELWAPFHKFLAYSQRLCLKTPLSTEFSSSSSYFTVKWVRAVTNPSYRSHCSVYPLTDFQWESGSLKASSYCWNPCLINPSCSVTPCVLAAPCIKCLFVKCMYSKNFWIE